MLRNMDTDMPAAPTTEAVPMVGSGLDFPGQPLPDTEDDFCGGQLPRSGGTEDPSNFELNGAWPYSGGGVFGGGLFSGGGALSALPASAVGAGGAFSALPGPPMYGGGGGAAFGQLLYPKGAFFDGGGAGAWPLSAATDPLGGGGGFFGGTFAGYCGGGAGRFGGRGGSLASLHRICKLA